MGGVSLQKRWLLVAAIAAASSFALPSATGASSGPAPTGSAPHAGTSDATPTGVAPETETEGEGEPGPQPESIIGADGRTLVTATNAYPSRTIGRIQVRFDGLAVPVFECTGFLVARNFVLTAGHCLYDFGNDVTRGRATSFSFTPGQNGGTSFRPTCSADRFFVNRGWKDNPRPGNDYGGVRLNCDLTAAGWLGMIAYPNTNTPTGKAAHVRGYPTDRPAGTMWTMRGRVQGSTTELLFHDVDTFDGQSGSPIFKWEDPPGSLPAGWYALGLHAYGTGLTNAPCNCNAGPRITNNRLSQITGWINS